MPTPAPTPVVLDVDTGVDDALAVLLAAQAPELELLGVTCVAGNVDIDQVVSNTLAVLQAAGRADVPVARGAERPLLEPHRHAAHIHGAQGLADVEIPPARHAVSEHGAVEALRQHLIHAPTPATVVALGPLTNIALLVRTYPEAARRIGRLVFMGGSAVAPGNATPVAEFNIWHDPEAAAIVLQSSIPLTMYGLDVFYPVVIERSQALAMVAARRNVPDLAGRLLLAQMDRGGSDETTLGDAGVVAALLVPQAVSARSLPVQINLAAGPGRGQTVVDRRTPESGRQLGTSNESGRLVDVCLSIDTELIARTYVDRIIGNG